MNAVSFPIAPSWVGKSLAIISVAFFWCLPWSPLVAIAALIATRRIPAGRVNSQLLAQFFVRHLQSHSP